jgi:hypothetical protein
MSAYSLFMNECKKKSKVLMLHVCDELSPECFAEAGAFYRDRVCE